MSNNIKQAMEDIPIPEALHERSLMGIHQAKEEWDAALVAPKKRKRIKNRMVAASLLGLLSLGTAATFNPHLSEAIQRALQFIPGIGVVQESGADSYMLTEPVDIKNNKKSATVTAMLVEKDMTTIEMNIYTNDYYDIRIKDESDAVHKISSAHISGGNDFGQVTYKFASQVNVKNQAQLFFADRPDEVFTIPLSKVDSIDNLNDIGESVEIHDLKITAIPTPAGHKGRIFLSTENSNIFKYNDFFYNSPMKKGDLIIMNENITITDELGNDYTIDNKGTWIPFKDIYFNLGGSEVEKYTLTIPQLMSVGHENVKLSINIPEGEEGPLNQSFRIAGYPVELTKFKKFKSKDNKEYIEIHVEMPDSLQPSRSLKSFVVDGRASRGSGAIDQTTGEMEFFWIRYDPNSTKLDITVFEPIVELKGPWKFEIDADRFKSQQVANPE